MARSAARLVIQGQVQGVGYRWWVVQTARLFELNGWVRNRSDGSVEVLAIGEASAIDRLARACRGGPSAAAVKSVDIQSAEDDGSLGFEQKATL